MAIEEVMTGCISKGRRLVWSTEPLYRNSASRSLTRMPMLSTVVSSAAQWHLDGIEQTEKLTSCDEKSTMLLNTSFLSPTVSCSLPSSFWTMDGL